MRLQVGKVEKAHGLQGDVIVSLSTNVTERVAPGSVLYTDDRALHVVRSTPHHHRFIVTFDGMSTREQADALRGSVLSADALEDDEPDTLWIHELIGRRVLERDGTDRGVVVAVIDNPASDLLELESGALVPLRFIVEHDDPQRLVIDPPLGLFDA